METAVNFLINYLIENFHLTDESYEKFEEVKEMEKEQIIQTYIDARNLDKSAEEYYTETFISE